MSEKPLVSILIPCYNHEMFLNDCLNSIIDQDYANIELLICDDCSSDNSYEVIQSFAKELNRRFIRTIILRNEINRGVTINVNRLLALATGKYIKILASDDALQVNAISCMVSFLEESPHIDVAISNGYKISEDQHYPDFRFNEKIYLHSPDFSMPGFFERIAMCNEISAPAAIVRKRVYEEYGKYDETIKIEDFEFWLRILKDKKTQFGYIDKELVLYRMNANSMSSMVYNDQLASRRKLMHSSEIDSLNKYSSYMDKAVFYNAVLSRTIQEYGFAVSHKFVEYEKMLRQEAQSVLKEASIPLRQKATYYYVMLKLTVKSMIFKR